MLIKNGFLIDPASDTERLVDLRITDGLIQTLADAGTLTPENGEDELDAAGLMISPGLVDTHIHFRDPGFFIPVHLLLQKADLQVSSAWQILHRSSILFRFSKN